MGVLVALALLTGDPQEDYFPLKEGTVWTYETVSGRGFVKRVLGTDRVGEAACTLVQLGETEKHWLTAQKDGVRVHRSKGMTYDTPLLLFKFPLKAGDRWDGEAGSSEGAYRYDFSNGGEEDVEVPAGKFRAYRIDWTMTRGETRVRGKTWLARGVGSVKESYTVGDRETGLSLRRVQGTADPYFPLAKGNRWTYRTDYDENTDIVHEVAAAEKLGEVECLVMEYKSHNEKEKRTRVLRKEWLSATDEGVKVHQVVRGISTFPVEAPFFKLKSPIRKGDEWKGATKGAENPPRYHYVVEEEEDVEVPAGKFRAWKVRFKIESGERHAAEGHEWWAKNAGLVKFELTIRGGDFSMVAELKEFKGPPK